MKGFALLFALAIPFPVQALDTACEPFISAAEKSAEQDSRHTFSQFAGGTRVEMILIGDSAYMMMGDKKWKKLPIDLRAAERQVNADVRNGKIKVENCEDMGSEIVDGVVTSVLSYTITMSDSPPTPPVRAKIYIGKDGLPYQQSSEQAKVRHRYTGVTAPQL